jgi:hypothetical protein
MSTLDFDAIPDWMASNIARDTLRAVKRTMQTPEGRALLEKKIDERKKKEVNK